MSSPSNGPSAALKMLVVGTVTALAVWEAGSYLSGRAADHGLSRGDHAGHSLIDLFGVLRQIGGTLPNMRLDETEHDRIEDRHGDPNGDLPGRIGFPGRSGYCPGRFPGGGYAQGGPPPMPPMPAPGDDYQGRQDREPPPMPPPPGRSGSRPPPGGPSGDSSDWWDDQHFHTERSGRQLRDCAASGRRCGPWNTGPVPGDPIKESPMWKSREGR